MNSYNLNGEVVTVKDLSEMSGLPEATIRYRIRRGYSVEQAIQPIAETESVIDFCDHSDYTDWLGLSTEEVYEVYWRWCLKSIYEPLCKQTFMKNLLRFHWNLETIPTKRGGISVRIIREKRKDKNNGYKL